jgi:hypothetical protein
VVAAIYDVHTTNDLARAFEEDLRKSAAVKVREVRDKGLLDRLGEGGARLFSPLL